MKTTLKASNIKKISAQRNTVPISRTLKKKLEQCGQMHPNDLNFLSEKTKKKSTKALRFIQSHGDRGHVSKQGCALALSESI